MSCISRFLYFFLLSLFLTSLLVSCGSKEDVRPTALYSVDVNDVPPARVKGADTHSLHYLMMPDGSIRQQ